MPEALLSAVLSGLGRDALKVAAGLALAVMIAVAFTIASLAAILDGPAANLTWRPSAQPTQMSAGRVGSTVMRIARTQLGKPYVWGGASPTTNFDCSGLVQWVYRQVGIDLPRTAQQQFVATDRLAPNQPQPGDLVFFAHTNPVSTEFITHVGIYAGNGRMVNAPNEGDVVREMPAFTGFWCTHYVGAGRVGR